MISIFIFLQITLLMLIFLPNWLPISSFNKVNIQSKEKSTFIRAVISIIDATPSVIAIFITIVYVHSSKIPMPASGWIMGIYLILTMLSIASCFVRIMESLLNRWKRNSAQESVNGQTGIKKDTNNQLTLSHLEKVGLYALRSAQYLLIWICFAFAIYIMIHRPV